MKNYKFSYCLLVLGFLSAFAFLSPADLTAKSIRMAWATLPPHNFAPEGDGPPTGPNIELFNAIAARMGYKVEWVGPLPLSRITSEQETGELGLDGTTLAIKTPEWIKNLLYPSKPYFTATPCLGVRVDNPLQKINTIRDIDGYRIGFAKTLASLYPPVIANNKKRLILDELTGDDWVKRNLRKMFEGRLDAVFELNKYSILYEAAMLGEENNVKCLLLPSETLDHYYVFFKISPKARILLNAYERAVAGYKFDYNAMLEAEIARQVKSGK
jgi:ABC-type amino acid transport substrate-binding protein